MGKKRKDFRKAPPKQPITKRMAQAIQEQEERERERELLESDKNLPFELEDLDAKPSQTTIQ